MLRRKRVWIPGAILLAIGILLLIGSLFSSEIRAFMAIDQSDKQPDVPYPDNVVAVKDIVYPTENYDGRLDFYYPEDDQGTLPIVIYIHGGGWIGGDKDAQNPFTMWIASKGYLVVNVNYGLAPEYTFPAQLYQLNDAIGFALREAPRYHGDTEQVFVGGGSAGANLAGMVAAMATNPTTESVVGENSALQSDQLKGVLLYNGVLNLEQAQQTGFNNMTTFLWSYTGNKNFNSDPRLRDMSPVFQITPDYPPAFISSGESDKLHPQSVEMADALDSIGVEVERMFFDTSHPAAGHEYQRKLYLDEAQYSFDHMIDFLRTHSE
ncbi:Acetyl esterase/lipase [Terribacillus halophilus]|uniref:Acetyl esterase/lipase n=1 Tax=Terribacillus halophilus TaxID=361279 RepID=A0A1G6KGP2_9BACI|nr:alpha/beta hydrolase [Terribacillus halophilus]SDC30134.1 Acetyl esterase/lipase [Terribacillus halophilus]